MTPAERFFKARDAWLKYETGVGFAVDPVRTSRSLCDEYVLARLEWAGWKQYMDALEELGR